MPPPTMMIRNVLVAASIAILLNVSVCMLGMASRVREGDENLV